MACSSDIKKEVSEFFISVLMKKDGGPIPYSNLRGYAVEASEGVKQYIKQNCKGENLLDFFQRQKCYFLVEKYDVSLKKKMPHQLLKDEVKENAAASNKNDHCHFFDHLTSDSCLSQENAEQTSSERTEYDLITREYFIKYLNRHHEVVISAIDFETLPKKVCRFLVKFKKKNVASFFHNYPDLFLVDGDYVRLITQFSVATKPPAAEGISPEGTAIEASNARRKVMNPSEKEWKIPLKENLKLNQNFTKNSPDNFLDCANYFVKILEAKSPIQVKKMSGYFSCAPKRISSYMKQNYKPWLLFFEAAPKLFSLSENKISLCGNYKKTLQDANKFVKLSWFSKKPAEDVIKSLFSIEEEFSSKNEHKLADTNVERIQSEKSSGTAKVKDLGTNVSMPKELHAKYKSNKIAKSGSSKSTDDVQKSLSSIFKVKSSKKIKNNNSGKLESGESNVRERDTENISLKVEVEASEADSFTFNELNANRKFNKIPQAASSKSTEDVERLFLSITDVKSSKELKLGYSEMEKKNLVDISRQIEVGASDNNSFITKEQNADCKIIEKVNGSGYCDKKNFVSSSSPSPVVTTLYDLEANERYEIGCGEMFDYLIDCFYSVHLICFEILERESSLCLAYDYKAVKFFVDILLSSPSASLGGMKYLQGKLGQADGDVLRLMRQLYKGDKIKNFFMEHKEFIFDPTDLSVELSTAYAVHLQNTAEVPQSFVRSKEYIEKLCDLPWVQLCVEFFKGLLQLVTFLQQKQKVKLSRLWGHISAMHSFIDIVNKVNGKDQLEKLENILCNFKCLVQIGEKNFMLKDEARSDLFLCILREFSSSQSKNLNVMSAVYSYPCFLEYGDLKMQIVQQIDCVLNNIDYVSYSELPKELGAFIMHNIFHCGLWCPDILWILTESDLFDFVDGKISKKKDSKISCSEKTKPKSQPKTVSVENKQSKDEENMHDICKGNKSSIGAESKVDATNTSHETSSEINLNMKQAESFPVKDEEQICDLHAVTSCCSYEDIASVDDEKDISDPYMSADEIEKNEFFTADVGEVFSIGSIIENVPCSDKKTESDVCSSEDKLYETNTNAVQRLPSSDEVLCEISTNAVRRLPTLDEKFRETDTNAEQKLPSLGGKFHETDSNAEQRLPSKDQNFYETDTNVEQRIPSLLEELNESDQNTEQRLLSSDEEFYEIDPNIDLRLQSSDKNLHDTDTNTDQKLSSDKDPNRIWELVENSLDSLPDLNSSEFGMLNSQKYDQVTRAIDENSKTIVASENNLFDNQAKQFFQKDAAMSEIASYECEDEKSESSSFGERNLFDKLSESKEPVIILQTTPEATLTEFLNAQNGNKVAGYVSSDVSCEETSFFESMPQEVNKATNSADSRNNDEKNNPSDSGVDISEITCSDLDTSPETCEALNFPCSNLNSLEDLKPDKSAGKSSTAIKSLHLAQKADNCAIDLKTSSDCLSSLVDSFARQMKHANGLCSIDSLNTNSENETFDMELFMEIYSNLDKVEDAVNLNNTPTASPDKMDSVEKHVPELIQRTSELCAVDSSLVNVSNEEFDIYKFALDVEKGSIDCSLDSVHEEEEKHSFDHYEKTSSMVMSHGDQNNYGLPKIAKLNTPPIEDSEKCNIPNPKHLSDYPMFLQPLSAKIVLLSSDTCVAESTVYGMEKLIFCLKSSFHCDEHNESDLCFNALVVGDFVSCYTYTASSGCNPETVFFSYMFCKETEASVSSNCHSKKRQLFQSTKSQEELVLSNCDSYSSDLSCAFHPAGSVSDKMSTVEPAKCDSINCATDILDKSLLVTGNRNSSCSMAPVAVVKSEAFAQTEMTGEVKPCCDVKEKGTGVEFSSYMQGTQTHFESPENGSQTCAPRSCVKQSQTTLTVVQHGTQTVICCAEQSSQTGIAGNIRPCVENSSSAFQTILSGEVKGCPELVSKFSQSTSQSLSISKRFSMSFESSEEEKLSVKCKSSETVQSTFPVDGKTKISIDSASQTYSTGAVMVLNYLP